MEIYSLSNRVASGHMWLLNIWSMAYVTEELNFYFILIKYKYLHVASTVLDSKDKGVYYIMWIQ